MGSGVLVRLVGVGAPGLVACDLAYDSPSSDSVEPPWCPTLRAEAGRFTDACLSRGGLIVATTIGHELARSSFDKIPAGTALLLAHNLALPEGDPGIELARHLAGRGVLVIPGQVLTLGGALTARLEWYWRQRTPVTPFDKALAHRVVGRVVTHLITELIALGEFAAITPYEALLRLEHAAEVAAPFDTAVAAGDQRHEVTL
jgi:hypothetical protein